MSTNKSSVVRYRYKAVHILNKILRDDLHSSDGGFDCEFTSSNTEYENGTFTAESACKIPDVCDEQDSSQLLCSAYEYISNSVAMWQGE